MTEQEKDFKTALTESIGMVAVDGSSSPIAMIDLMDAHLSDRDKFAIGFVEWIRNEAPYIHAETIEAYYNHILWLYKQSLTKTDKA